jgi:excisionase family DNA binding protein
MIMESEYMTTAEVAELVRAPSETVRYWDHIGKMPKSIKLGRRRLFRRVDVLRWLEDQFAEQVES